MTELRKRTKGELDEVIGGSFLSAKGRDDRNEAISIAVDSQKDVLEDSEKRYQYGIYIAIKTILEIARSSTAYHGLKYIRSQRESYADVEDPSGFGGEILQKIAVLTGVDSGDMLASTNEKALFRNIRRKSEEAARSMFFAKFIAKNLDMISAADKMNEHEILIAGNLFGVSLPKGIDQRAKVINQRLLEVLPKGIDQRAKIINQKLLEIFQGTSVKIGLLWKRSDKQTRKTVRDLIPVQQ